MCWGLHAGLALCCSLVNCKACRYTNTTCLFRCVSFMALISLALQESVCSMSLVPGNYVVVFCSREPPNL